MRDAIVITISLIIAFMIFGYAYNLMQPYLVKLGVIEKPTTAVELGPDGGVFRSADSGRTWEQKISVKNDQEFEKSNVFAIKFSPEDPSVLYAATSRGLFISSNSANIWRPIFQESIGADESVLAFAIDPKNSQRQYIATYLDKKGTRILKTKGEGFYEVYSSTSLENRITGLWIDSYDPSVIYAGVASGFLLISYDFGESWGIMHDFASAVSDLAMTPSDTRIIYLSAGGKIFKTTTQGNAWQDISPLDWEVKQSSFTVNHIAINSHNEGEIYTATSEGLFRSHDGGASFGLVNLPVSNQTLAINALYLSTVKENLILLGVGSQIYKSDDAGATWQIKNIETSRKINIIAAKPNDSLTIFVGVKQ